MIYTNGMRESERERARENSSSTNGWQLRQIVEEHFPQHSRRGMFRFYRYKCTYNYWWCLMNIYMEMVWWKIILPGIRMSVCQYAVHLCSHPREKLEQSLSNHLVWDFALLDAHPFNIRFNRVTIGVNDGYQDDLKQNRVTHVSVRKLSLNSGMDGCKPRDQWSQWYIIGLI